jgi:DtxR family Mn-dependent transcriptional regulator
MSETLMEDILKAMYHARRDHVEVSSAYLKERFSEPSDEMDSMLERMFQDQWLRRREGLLELTEKGWVRAVELVRAHRLLESHLAAERTRATKLHQQAEILEHQVTSAELQAMAGELNHPRFDPHGDPIPTEEGRLPQLERVGLKDWPEGKEGLVAHLEDEPESAFEELQQFALVPGMHLRVEGRSADRVDLWIDGRKIGIPVSLESLITIEPLKSSDSELGDVRLLVDLQPGEKAQIVKIGAWIRGSERSRLLDLGIVPGTPVAVDMRSALGSPVAYLIRGTSIALRRDQSEYIMIRKQPSGGANE